MHVHYIHVCLQRARAVHSLTSFLTSETMSSVSSRLAQGVAKRLLSVCLCLPSDGSQPAENQSLNDDGQKDTQTRKTKKLNQSKNQTKKSRTQMEMKSDSGTCQHHLLTLAYEAMHLHLSVLDCVVKCKNDKQYGKYNCFYFDIITFFVFLLKKNKICEH